MSRGVEISSLLSFSQHLEASRDTESALVPKHGAGERASTERSPRPQQLRLPTATSGLLEHDSPHSGGPAALRKAGHLVLVVPAGTEVSCRGLRQPASAAVRDAPQSQGLRQGRGCRAHRWGVPVLGPAVLTQRAGPGQAGPSRVITPEASAGTRPASCPLTPYWTKPVTRERVGSVIPLQGE